MPFSFVISPVQLSVCLFFSLFAAFFVSTSFGAIFYGFENSQWTKVRDWMRWEKTQTAFAFIIAIGITFNGYNGKSKLIVEIGFLPRI